jgi:hypothetical protein
METILGKRGVGRRRRRRVGFAFAGDGDCPNMYMSIGMTRLFARGKQVLDMKYVV